MFEAPFFAFLAAFVLNLVVTPWVIHLLRREHMLDIPNARSSHDTPVPRGGGLMIVFTWLLGISATWAIRFPWPALGTLAPDGFIIGTAGGMLALAVLGFLDDRRDLSPLLKLVVQIVVCVQALALSGLRLADFGLPLGDPLDLGAFGWLAAVAWLVAFTNIFNFMDGINGLAFTQLITGGAAFCVLGARTGDYELAVAGALAAGSALGILKYNFPQALVFMGDVGSLPSGFLLAMLGLRTAFGRGGAEISFLVPVLVLWPFVYDGSYTLLNRLVHGRNPLKAHRSHLYQRLLVAGLNHLRTTSLYAAAMTACGVLAHLLPALTVGQTAWALGAVLVASVAVTVLIVTRVRADETVPHGATE